MARRKFASKSRIVAKKWNKKGGIYRGVSLLKNKKPYNTEFGKISHLFHRLLSIGKLSEEQASTVKVFCRNHYMTHKTLPSFQELKKVFPYLREIEPEVVWDTGVD